MNEFSTNITNINQHTGSHNISKNCNISNQTKHDIHSMDIEPSKEEQNIFNGHSANDLHTIQDNNPFYKIEEKLNLIQISDDEDDVNFNDINNNTKKIDNETYNIESAKIEKLYEKNFDEETGPSSYYPTKNEHTTYDIPLKEIEKLKNLSYFNSLNDYNLINIGSVESIIDKQIIVKKNPYKEMVNLDSIVIIKNSNDTNNSSKYLPIGFVYDIIGNIEDPYYVVNFLNGLDDEINNSSQLSNMFSNYHSLELYCDKSHSNIVDIKVLMNNKYKGTDASNAFDEEVNKSDNDYSDDEEEIKNKKLKKNKYKEDLNFKTNYANIKNENNNNNNNNNNYTYTYNKSNLSLKPDQINPFSGLN